MYARESLGVLVRWRKLNILSTIRTSPHIAHDRGLGYA